MQNYSNFTIYVDESGDHGLERINPEYPLFVLAFCLTAKEDLSDGHRPRDRRLQASLVRP